MNKPSFQLLNRSDHTPKDVEKYYEEWTDQYVEFGRVWQSLLTPNVNVNHSLLFFCSFVVELKSLPL